MQFPWLFNFMALRSTFLGIEVSKRGLAVNQKSLDITANNVSNMYVDGYTRQRVDIASVSVTGAYRYGAGKVENTGAGSDIQGVSQIRDKFMDVRYRDAFANTQYYEQQLKILTGVQDAIDEISSDGLLKVYQDAISAMQNLSLNPNDAVYATTAKSSINNVCKMLNQFDKSLKDVADQQIYDTSVVVESMNTCLSKIAQINQALKLESNNELSNVYQSNELNDSLNLLLDELSGYADIDVKWNDDTTVTVKINGDTVIDGAWCDQVQMNEHDDRTIDIIYKSTGKQCTFESGLVKANTDYINGNDELTRGVQYYMNQMNSFAKQFASILNNSISEGTIDADGNATDVQFKTLIGSLDDSAEEITAGNITISDAWIQSAQYIQKNRVIDGKGTVDNQNTDYLSLINKLQSDYQIGTFKGSLEDFVEKMNTDVGEDMTFAKSRFDACEIISNDLDNKRDEVSGVSLDEEGANLLVYEKAYSAMARVMTAMDEVLEKLINGTGLVGR